MNRDYQIIVKSPKTGDVVTVITPSTSFAMKYSILVNDIGKFALTLSNDRNWESLLKLDSQLEIYRENDSGEFELEAVYFVRAWDKFIENVSERIIIGGVHVNHLLDRRLVDPDDDPLASGGYSTKGGAAGDIIRDYVREQCGDLASNERSFPEFTVPTPTDAGSSTGAVLRYDKLFDSIQNIALNGGIEFEVRRAESGGKALELFIGNLGQDRTVTTNEFPPYLFFSPYLGNIQSPSLNHDRTKEVNFLYALGEGEGINRTVLKVPSNTTADSPYNRIERKYDGRSAEKDDPLALLSGTVAQLEEKRPVRELEFETLPFAGGAQYKTDWNLGDKVTVIWGDFQQDLQITGIEVTVQGLQEQIVPKIDLL